MEPIDVYVATQIAQNITKNIETSDEHKKIVSLLKKSSTLSDLEIKNLLYDAYVLSHSMTVDEMMKIV